MKDNVIYNKWDNEVMVKTAGDLIYIVCHKEEQQEKVVQKMTTDNVENIRETFKKENDSKVQNNKEGSKQAIKRARKELREKNIKEKNQLMTSLTKLMKTTES